MNNSKGYLTAEFVIVVIIFMFILVVFGSNFNSIVPAEINRIKSETACLQADLLAESLLNHPGNSTNWDASGKLDHLGFSTGEFGVLNYSKWVKAQEWGYTNITNNTGLNTSFAIKYSAYSLKRPTKYKGRVTSSAPGPTAYAMIYFANASQIGVYARNTDSSKTLVADIELFFPYENITLNYTSFTGSGLETGTDYAHITNYSGTNGSSATFHFEVSGEADQARINLTSGIDVAFVKSLNFRSISALSKDFPIYFNNHTATSSVSCNTKDCPSYGLLIKDQFGSTGLTDASKNYCEIKRKFVLLNNSQKVGVDISVISMR